MNQPLNNDGYRDLITGLGTRRDPIASAQLQSFIDLQESELTSIFRSGGVGRLIVELPAEEMVRPWFDLVGDDSAEDALDALETLGAQEALTEALVWARLYGGAAIVHVLEDGLAPDQPVDERRIQEVVGYRVFDRHQITPELVVATDRRLMLAGRAEFYTLTQFGGEQLRVHRSRISFIPGKRTPERIRQMQSGWDDSTLRACYEELKRFEVSLGYATSILKDFVQAVLSVKGLTNMIASGQEAVVERRMRLLDLSRSILGAMVIDADGEEFVKASSSVTGIPELLDRIGEVLSGATGIPVSKLFGRSAGGLQSTGEMETRNYYDMLAAERHRVASTAVEQMVRLLYLSKKGPTGGQEPENWSVQWRPFEQPSEKDIAALRKTVAETDKLYIDTGVLSPAEIAESRFGLGEWSIETNLVDGTERSEEAETATEEAPEPGAEEALDGRQDATPRTLYVSRNVLNVAEIKAWAKEQGVDVTVEPLHVTVLHSRAPVDWMKMGDSWSNAANGELTLAPGGARVLDRFGDTNVLLFASSELSWRHQTMVHAGASHDYPEYQPHISLNEDPEGRDLRGLEPYRGKIVLGPEIFEEVKA